MYLCRSILLAAVLILKAGCQLIGDLPSDIIADILSILINGTVHALGDCRDADSAPLTNYWVYTSDNPDNYTNVTEPTPLTCEGRTKIIFLAHGWTWDANAPYIIAIKNAYLSRYSDSCIISVNWDAYSLKNYISAYCAVPGVANNVASFLCALSTNLNISLSTVHLVGHSMGAQVFGIAGGLLQDQCGTVGRITGLDPAGPLYNGIATKDRLDPTDATFVDVIHTNQAQYGYLGSCGDLDAYPNCGFFQPGCFDFVMEQVDFNNITEILRIPQKLLSCNHRRSCEYFEESIRSDLFVAKQCLRCGEILSHCENSTASERKVIGEDCTSPGNVQNYVLSTASSPPYALG